MRRSRLFIVAALVVCGFVAYFLRRRSETIGAASIATASADPTGAEPARPRPTPADPAEARRARDAMRAKILETLRKRGETVRPDPPPTKAAAKAQAKSEPSPQGKYDTEYIRSNFREDMFPLLKSCYEDALKRKPALAGKLILGFTIVGDKDVGGVIEDADIEDESTLKDDDMETCVRESLMTLTFDKPPTGGGYVTVKYPVAFSPDDEPPGDAGSASDAGM